MDDNRTFEDLRNDITERTNNLLTAIDEHYESNSAVLTSIQSDLREGELEVLSLVTREDLVSKMDAQTAEIRLAIEDATIVREVLVEVPVEIPPIDEPNLPPEPEPEPPTNVVPNRLSVWTDSTGFQWVVADNDGDYTMLTARFMLQMNDERWNRNAGGIAITNNRLHNLSSFTSWPASTATTTGGPEGRRRMHNWWNHDTQVSPELRAAAVHANIPMQTVVTGWSTAYNNTDHLSTPTGVLAGDENPLFFLSLVEIFQRLGQTDNNARAPHRVNHETFASTGVSVSYWIRSVGNNTSTNASISITGGISGGNASNATTANLSFRPAVWVRNDTGLFNAGMQPRMQTFMEDTLQTNQYLTAQLATQATTIEALKTTTYDLAKKVLNPEQVIALEALIENQCSDNNLEGDDING